MTGREKRSWMAVFLCVGIAACDGDGGSEGESHGPEEGSHGGADVVRLDPRAMGGSGIRLAQVESAPVADEVRLPAEVRLDPDRTAHVTSLVPGQLTRVQAALGDRVKEGEVLASLRSVELGETRSDLSRAQAEVEVARAHLERQETLREEGIGSEREYMNAKAELARAEAALSSARRRLGVYGRGGSGSGTVLRSPLDGEVITRDATVGEVVGPEEVLFTVADLDPVWVVGQAYQRDAGRMERGARATLRLPAYPDRTWEGEVSYVAPAMDEHTRTLPVRVVLDNPEGKLRPGLFGEMRVHAGRADPVPTIAAGSSTTVGDRTIVFVPGDGKGVFRVKEVTLGAESSGRVQVIEGLKPGDRYVSEGVFVLKSELQRGMLSGGHAH